MIKVPHEVRVRADAALRFLPVAGDTAPSATAGNVRTMSSVEIAELTGKRHQDVLRDIRNMLEPLGMAFAQFCAKVPSAGGRPMTVANLPRRECLILVSGYNIELRARIIDRWEELERQNAAPPSLPDLSNPKVLLSLLSDYANDKLALEGRVAEMAPKVEALDRLATADGSLCITDAAKALQIRPKDLFDYLSRNGWIYRRPNTSGYLGYQSRVVAGVLEHKVTTVQRADGSEKVTEQVRVTAKGLTKLSQLTQTMGARM